MKVKVKFFPRIKEVFQMSEGEISLKTGANVRDLLNLLCNTDDRRSKLFDSDGRTLRPNVVIRKIGRFIVHLNWLDTELEENDWCRNSFFCQWRMSLTFNPQPMPFIPDFQFM